MEPKQQAPYPLRMPAEMRAHYEDMAALSKRSLNAEIVAGLDELQALRNRNESLSHELARLRKEAETAQYYEDQSSQEIERLRELVETADERIARAMLYTKQLEEGGDQAMRAAVHAQWQSLSLIAYCIGQIARRKKDDPPATKELRGQLLTLSFFLLGGNTPEARRQAFEIAFGQTMEEAQLPLFIAKEESARERRASKRSTPRNFDKPQP